MNGPNRLLGPYELVKEIAKGGMGSVYEARHRVTGKPRAVKVIRAELSSDREFVERFLREVRIAASLEHPNLVRVHEPGIDGSAVFLPMELLVGETLWHRLRRGPVRLEEIPDLLRPVCDALQALHERGIIHRDLKPLNIFLAEQDGAVVPKVLDLGAARDVSDDPHTRTGLVVGSPHYMAPEQAAGKRDLDGRVDQYALGVIGYQMLTGRRPYEADDGGNVISKLLRAEPFPKPTELEPEVSPALEAVILRAMAYEREDRFDRITEFAVALEQAVGGERTLAIESPDAVERTGQDPFPAPSPPEPHPIRGRVAVALGVVALLAVGSVAFLALRGGGTSAQNTANATRADIRPATTSSETTTESEEPAVASEGRQTTDGSPGEEPERDEPTGPAAGTSTLTTEPSQSPPPEPRRRRSAPTVRRGPPAPPSRSAIGDGSAPPSAGLRGREESVGHEPSSSPPDLDCGGNTGVPCAPF